MNEPQTMEDFLFENVQTWMVKEGYAPGYAKMLTDEILERIKFEQSRLLQEVLGKEKTFWIQTDGNLRIVQVLDIESIAQHWGIELAGSEEGK